MFFFLLYECDAMGDERESYLWLAYSSFNLVLLVDFTRLHRMIEQIVQCMLGSKKRVARRSEEVGD